MSNKCAVNELHSALVAYIERHGTSRDTAALIEAAVHLIQQGCVRVAPDEQEDVVGQVVDRIVGWGPLTKFLNDQSITEIMVNGADSVYIEREGVLSRVSGCDINEDELTQIINRMVGMVGRRIDTSSPLVDARLPDGSRVNAIIPPLSLTGPILTIRRFPARPMTIADLVAKGTLNQPMAKFLKMSILAKQNIIISGGTGSGKTTTLNALASCISHSERIITIEDAAEMRLIHPHLVSLEARPPNLEGRGEVAVRLLLKNALRMRPDRIIIGEIRGGESLDMLQAMNTGHQGSLTTVHANAPLEALLRIETMALMADVDLPLGAIREQIKQALHLVVQQERMKDGRRVIVAINELERQLPYSLRPIFTYDRDTGVFNSNGV